MGGTGTVPDANRGWLAKVLAGDPLACGVLDLARSLPADEWDAFAGSVEGIRAGMSAADVLDALRREQGGNHPRFG